MKLKKAKESVSIPVFASLNAVNDDTWIEYAREIEKTGVDGLELNFYTLPEKSDDNYEDMEAKQLKTLMKVRAAVKIPLSVKLSPYYTNPLKFISELEACRSKCDSSSSTGFFNPTSTSKPKSITSRTV